MVKTSGSVNDAGAAGAPFQKLMAGWPMFAFNYEIMLDGQRRNWAALVEVNRVWSESAQALATRQMELARQTMHDLTEFVEETVSKPGAFEDQMGKGATCTRHALEGMFDLADHATKSSAEVMKLFNKRMSETLEDARHYAEHMPHAGSGSVDAAAAD